MTSLPVTLPLSAQLENTARATVRQAAYVLLTDTSGIDVDKVSWHGDYLDDAGPGPPDAIIGCIAKARLTIRWEHAGGNADPEIIHQAAAAIEDLRFSPVWLRAILSHEPPPPGKALMGDIQNLRWSVRRKGDPTYDAANGRLTFAVEIHGAK